MSVITLYLIIKWSFAVHKMMLSSAPKTLVVGNELQSWTFLTSDTPPKIMSLFRTPSARFGNLIDSGDTRKRAVDIPLYSGWSNVTNVKKMLRIALFDWLEMLKHFDAIGPNVILLRRDWLCSSTLLDISKILSDDPLSGSAQGSSLFGGVGSNPTAAKGNFLEDFAGWHGQAKSFPWPR